MKYLINYGVGIATLYTPEADWESRFTELAGSCWGIRKSILWVELLGQTDEEPTDKQPEEHERLDFGDVYIWRRDGARKMIAPESVADEEWDESYCRNADEAAAEEMGALGKGAEGTGELYESKETERLGPEDNDGGVAADNCEDAEAAARRVIEKLGAEELFLRLSGVCPCCGGVAMRDKAELNALSRHADAYICSGCGKAEALRAATELQPKPLSEWKLAVFAALFSPPEEVQTDA